MSSRSGNPQAAKIIVPAVALADSARNSRLVSFIGFVAVLRLMLMISRFRLVVA